MNVCRPRRGRARTSSTRRRSTRPAARIRSTRAPAPVTARRPAARSRRARWSSTPELDLKKIATPVAPATAPLEAGEQIQWTFLVTNKSAVTVDHVAVTDPKAGRGHLPGDLARARPHRRPAPRRPSTPSPRPTSSAGEVDNTATASATLPGCTGAIGGATCPIVLSNPSSTQTPTISAPTIALTKALGSARYADRRSVHRGIRTGSATGTVVNATTELDDGRNRLERRQRHRHDRHLRRHDRDRVLPDRIRERRTRRSTARRSAAPTRTAGRPDCRRRHRVHRHAGDHTGRRGQRSVAR